jgi:hypothetical protein
VRKAVSDYIESSENESNNFNRINDIFKIHFNSINQDSRPYEISECLENFRRELYRIDAISYEIDDDEITYSKKIPMELKFYFIYPDDLAKFIAGFFGTTHFFVLNRKNTDGIIFIGQENNILATQLVFEYLAKIADDNYNAYMATLKRYKKQESKDDKAREHMNDWLENIIYQCYDKRWFDASDKILFDDYVKQNFKTVDDERAALRDMAEMISPVFNSIKNESATLGEVREELFKLYPEDKIHETMEKVDAFSGQDLILSCNDYFDDDDDLEDD